MDEVFPVLAGIVVGVALHRVVPVWLRTCVLGVVSILLGATATWISGESANSWVYLLIDIGQVLVAGWMTSVLVSLWRGHSWRVS
jgi:hypothetical protein